MKSKTSKPCYGIIAQNGGYWTVQYHKENADGSSTTGNLQGYNVDVFRDCPADMPVIDYRTGDSDAVFRFAWDIDPPIEVRNPSRYDKTTMRLEEYLSAAEKAGATIRQVAEVYILENDKRYQIPKHIQDFIDLSMRDAVEPDTEPKNWTDLDGKPYSDHQYKFD